MSLFLLHYLSIAAGLVCDGCRIAAIATVAAKRCAALRIAADSYRLAISGVVAVAAAGRCVTGEGFGFSADCKGITVECLRC